jgi:hypothetical protein
MSSILDGGESQLRGPRKADPGTHDIWRLEGPRSNLNLVTRKIPSSSDQNRNPDYLSVALLRQRKAVPWIDFHCTPPSHRPQAVTLSSAAYFPLLHSSAPEVFTRMLIAGQIALATSGRKRLWKSRKLGKWWESSSVIIPAIHGTYFCSCTVVAWLSSLSSEDNILRVREPNWSGSKMESVRSVTTRMTCVILIRSSMIHYRGLPCLYQCSYLHKKQFFPECFKQEFKKSTIFVYV